MTDWVSDGRATQEDVLVVAEGLFREAATELYRTITALREGQFTEVKSAQAAIRELRATALQVLE